MCAWSPSTAGPVRHSQTRTSRGSRRRRPTARPDPRPREAARPNLRARPCARSAATSSGGASVRSRITCHRIVGSPSSSQSTTAMCRTYPPRSPVTGRRQVVRHFCTIWYMITLEPSRSRRPRPSCGTSSSTSSAGRSGPRRSRPSCLSTARSIEVGRRFEIKQPRMPKLVWEVTEVEPGVSWTWRQQSLGGTAFASHEVVAIDPSARSSGSASTSAGRWASSWRCSRGG